MAMNFVQTDTAANCSASAYSTGWTVGGDVDFNMLASGSATAGTGEVSVTLDANNSVTAAAWFECVVPDGSTWSGGSWTIPVYIKTAVSKTYITGCALVHVNSSCTRQEDLVVDTTLDIDIGTTSDTQGAYNVTVTGSAGTSPSAGDKVIVVLRFYNNNHAANTIGIIPSETITSPFSAPSITKNLNSSGASISSTYSKLGAKRSLKASAVSLATHDKLDTTITRGLEAVSAGTGSSSAKAQVTRAIIAAGVSLGVGKTPLAVIRALEGISVSFSNTSKATIVTGGTASLVAAGSSIGSNAGAYLETLTWIQQSDFTGPLLTLIEDGADDGPGGDWDTNLSIPWGVFRVDSGASTEYYYYYGGSDYYDVDSGTDAYRAQGVASGPNLANLTKYSGNPISRWLVPGINIEEGTVSMVPMYESGTGTWHFWWGANTGTTPSTIDMSIRYSTSNSPFDVDSGVEAFAIGGNETWPQAALKIDGTYYVYHLWIDGGPGGGQGRGPTYVVYGTDPASLGTNTQVLTDVYTKISITPYDATGKRYIFWGTRNNARGQWWTYYLNTDDPFTLLGPMSSGDFNNTLYWDSHLTHDLVSDDWVLSVHNTGDQHIMFRAYTPGAFTSSLSSAKASLGVTRQLNASSAALSAGTSTLSATALSDIYVTESPYFISGEPTTAQLTSPGGTFTPGMMIEDSGTAYFDVASGEYTEFEWSLANVDTISGRYEFRLVIWESNSGTALDTYTVTPEWYLGNVLNAAGVGISKGVATLTTGGGATQSLNSTSAAYSAGIASIQATRALTADAASFGSEKAVLGVIRDVKASSSSYGTATDTLQVTRSLNAVSAALGSSTSSVQLTKVLNAAAASYASDSANAQITRSLSAAATSISSSYSTIQATKALQSASTGLGSSKATISIQGQLTLAAQSSAYGSGSTTIQLTKALQAASNGISNGAAVLGVIRAVKAASSAISSATGIVTTKRALLATSDALGNATSSVTITRGLAAKAVSIASSTAALSATRVLTATAASYGSGLAVMLLEGQVAMAATSTAFSNVSAVLNATKHSVANSISLSSASAAISVTRDLQAASVSLAASAASVQLTRALAAASTAFANATSEIAVTRVLAAVSAGIQVNKAVLYSLAENALVAVNAAFGTASVNAQVTRGLKAAATSFGTSKGVSNPIVSVAASSAALGSAQARLGLKISLGVFGAAYQSSAATLSLTRRLLASDSSLSSAASVLNVTRSLRAISTGISSANSALRRDVALSAVGMAYGQGVVSAQRKVNIVATSVGFGTASVSSAIAKSLTASSMAFANNSASILLTRGLAASATSYSNEAAWLSATRVLTASSVQFSSAKATLQFPLSMPNSVAISYGSGTATLRLGFRPYVGTRVFHLDRRIRTIVLNKVRSLVLDDPSSCHA